MHDCIFYQERKGSLQKHLRMLRFSRRKLIANIYYTFSSFHQLRTKSCPLSLAEQRATVTSSTTKLSKQYYRVGRPLLLCHEVRALATRHPHERRSVRARVHVTEGARRNALVLFMRASLWLAAGCWPLMCALNLCSNHVTYSSYETSLHAL